MTELKPCPFCGSKPTPPVRHVTDAPGFADHNDVSWYVECGYAPHGCLAQGEHCDTKREAVAKWNRRPPDRAALVEVARRARTDFAVTVLRSWGASEFRIEEAARLCSSAHEMPWAERIVSEYLAEQAGKESK